MKTVELEFSDKVRFQFNIYFNQACDCYYFQTVSKYTGQQNKWQKVINSEDSLQISLTMCKPLLPKRMRSDCIIVFSL